VRDSLDKIQHYILTGRKMGIAVLAPSVESSDVDFTPSLDAQAIRFGLASVKGVGVGVVEAIVKTREEAPFSSLEDFLKRSNTKILNRKTMEALILAGALESFGYTRKHLMNNLETIFNYAEQCHKQAETGQASLFDLLAETDDGNAMSGLLLQGDASDEFSDDEIQRYEKDLLGFYVTSHPLDNIKETLPLMTTHRLSELPKLNDGDIVRVGGLISSVQHRLSKKNKPLIIGVVEDFTGEREFIVFGKAVEQLKPVLEAGKKLILKAKVSFRGDDSEQFSLVLNEALPIEECQPFELSFSAPPTYEEWVFLAKTLREHHGDVPTILHFSDGTRLKTGERFWVNPQAFGHVKQSLQRVMSTLG
jgi:DNA polymerase-3 subunit alpha